MADSDTQTTRKSGARKAEFNTSTGMRYALDRGFTGLVFAATFIGIVLLAILLIDVFRDGLPMISWDFITSPPSQIFPETAGISRPLIGSLWLLGLTALISVPIGVGAAIYLEEYARDTRLSRIVEVNISNLAGVPSVIYGLLGVGIFVQMLRPLTGGPSVLSGALTLSLLILPVIIVATREAFRSIPNSVREGGYALGATRWEVIRSHLLPMALPGALTGTILALSRAIGEAAPLLIVGASAYLTYNTVSPFERYMALPITIYDSTSRAQDVFQTYAASAIVVIVVVLLLANSVAIVVRNKYQKSS